MGLLDVIKGSNADKKMFDAQMQNEENKLAVDYATRSNDWASAGQDSQVNLYIVSNSRKFLPHKPVKIVKNGVEDVVWVKKEEYSDFLEPYSDDDSLSFSDEEGRHLSDEILKTNIMILDYCDRYDSNVDRGYWAREFNMGVRLREGLLVGTRTTGNPIKAAKSSSVSTKAEIHRVQQDQPKRQFGLF